MDRRRVLQRELAHQWWSTCSSNGSGCRTSVTIGLASTQQICDVCTRYLIDHHSLPPIVAPHFSRSIPASTSRIAGMATPAPTTNSPPTSAATHSDMDDESFSEGDSFHSSGDDDADMVEAVDVDSDDSLEDFMGERGGLDARFNVDEAHADDEGPDEDGVTDRSDRRYDIFRSRWIFLGRYFDDWFSTVTYDNQDACSYIAVKFDCFNVHLPFTTTQSQASDVYLQRLRDATELVGSMLRVDTSAWEFVKKTAHPSFRHFQVASYDPHELEPKMRFVLHQRWGNEPDQPDAIQRLRFMLLGCDRQVNPNRMGGSQFRKNKARISDLDTDGKLSGWKIPIAMKLTPREPTEATGVEPLRVYLREAIALVKDLLVKSQENITGSYPFRLVEVSVLLFTTGVSDVMQELRDLKSLGITVKIRMWHSRVGGTPWRIDWSHLGPRDNVYPALAEAPNSVAAALHSFNHGSIACSVPLLSAVASALTLSDLVLDLQTTTELGDALTHAKWLAYALRMNRSLRVLHLRGFAITNETLDVMQAVVQAANPAELLSAYDQGSPDVASAPRLVRLKPGSLISTTDNRDPRTLTELAIPLDWEFAVVSTHIKPAGIEFVLPGYALASAAETDVMSITSPPNTQASASQSQLTTLVLDGSHGLRAPVHRFLQFFGQSVQHLRWSMTGSQPLDLDDLERDLSATLTTCPFLKSFSLESSELSSLSLFTQRFQSVDCKLRTLAFLDLFVPAPAMIEFFEALGDPTTKISQKLDELYVYNQERPLDRQLAEAALRMLRTNVNLHHLTLCLQGPIFSTYMPRFRALEEAVIVRVRRVVVAKKLAFLSAQQHHHAKGDSAMGRLDSSSLALVFEFAAQSGRRRIQIFREDF